MDTSAHINAQTEYTLVKRKRKKGEKKHLLNMKPPHQNSHH